MRRNVLANNQPTETENIEGGGSWRKEWLKQKLEKGGKRMDAVLMKYTTNHNWKIKQSTEDCTEIL